MVTAAAIAYMMGLCNLTYTATQYALLSSLAAVASKTIAGAAGLVAELYGWTAMFTLSALMGLPAVVIWFMLKANPEPETTA
jgi:MFS transporter, PAT family, beta-lactamase induction signal transducer AmpG